MSVVKELSAVSRTVLMKLVPIAALVTQDTLRILMESHAMVGLKLQY